MRKVQVLLLLRHYRPEAQVIILNSQIKKRTLELLDNPEENTKKLQAICDKTAGKLLELAQQWEQHRKPLIE